MRANFLAGTVCALATAVAMDATAATVDVRLAGDTITVPIPEGYCEAKDRYLDVVQAAAAVDEQNITLVGFFDCREMAAGETKHFVYLKAVKSALTRRVPLPDLLAGIGAVPDSEMKAQLSNQEITERGISNVTGEDAKVTHNGIQPVDRDASAYYMAGVVELKIGAQETGGAVAIALTSVKGHVVGYDFYGPGDTAAAVKDVVDLAKIEVKRLLAAN